MREKLMSAILAMQTLEIKPTISNVKTMDAIFTTLLDINDELEANENAGAEGRLQDHSGGRDHD